MNVSQSSFRAAILDPSRPVPAGLRRFDGRNAGARFDVYRNNVVAGLIAALEVSFPVVRKLLGGDNFRVMAADYVRKHPPGMPLMMHFGGELPKFLAGFAPVSHLGYLPDVARLELALRQSYHAADSQPVAPDRLAALAPERLLAARFKLAPSLRVLASDWPVHAIWRYNTEDGAPKPAMRPEDVLIGRREFDPAPVLLPAGGADCLAALLAGQPFQTAIEPLAEADIGAVLAALLGQNAITDIIEDG